jgi:hypothetical protein
MIILTTDPRCTRVRFDADTMWVELIDGRTLGVPLSYFPRLLKATAAQRRQYTLSGGGAGLHWDKLDEDISVRGLILGHDDRTARRS